MKRALCRLFGHSILPTEIIVDQLGGQRPHAVTVKLKCVRCGITGESVSTVAEQLEVPMPDMKAMMEIAELERLRKL